MEIVSVSCYENFAWTHNKVINVRIIRIKICIATSAVSISRSQLLKHSIDVEIFLVCVIHKINQKISENVSLGIELIDRSWLMTCLEHSEVAVKILLEVTRQ